MVSVKTHSAAIPKERAVLATRSAQFPSAFPVTVAKGARQIVKFGPSADFHAKVARCERRAVAPLTATSNGSIRSYDSGSVGGSSCFVGWTHELYLIVFSRPQQRAYKAPGAPSPGAFSLLKVGRSQYCESPGGRGFFLIERYWRDNRGILEG